MALLERVIEQKAIIISLGVVLLPLAVAFILLIVSAVQKYGAAQSQKRQEKKRAMAERAQAKRSDEIAAVSVTIDGNKQAATASPTSQSQPRTANYAAGDQVQQPQLSQTGEGETPEEASDPEKKPEQENTVSSAMQDILSGVFGEDETLARYEILLNGLGDVGSSDLLALCNQVAGQLGCEVAVDAAK